MNTCPSSHSKQGKAKACPSSFNRLKRILATIALTLKSLLSYIWQDIFTPSSSELRVWQRRDRFGQIYWRVYDPITDRSARFSSEQELRQWLEKRFYNH